MQIHATELAELARQGTNKAMKKLIAYDKKIKPGYVAGKDAKQDKLVQYRNKLVLDICIVLGIRRKLNLAKNHENDLENTAAFTEVLEL